MSRFPEPALSIKARRATYRFYLGDEILDRLSHGSIDVIVTWPPYNLGI